MINIISGSRLKNDSYLRPEQTITESIQNKKDIEEQLKNYEEIEEEDINFLHLNTSLKYLKYDINLKKELYRFGGLLVKIDKEYLILAGKENKRFSVQRYTKDRNNNIIHKTRFFRKKKESEYFKEKYEESSDIIDKQQYVIEKQKQELIELKKKLKSSKK